MTPNIGQGANTAMEAAAGLTNMLHAITQDDKLPSSDIIEQALTALTTKHRKRLDAMHMESRWITRLESCQGRMTTAFARYIAPYCGDLFALGVVRNSYNGEVLQFLPLTERAGKNWPELEWWNTWGLSKWRDMCQKIGCRLLVLMVLWLINWMSGIEEL